MDTVLDYEHFTTINPRCRKPLEFVAALQKMLPQYDINNQKRISMFLAQTSWESGGYRRFKENLNYTAKRLNEVFPHRFVRAGVEAELYHRNPEKIGNYIYANRNDNGDVASGDGYRFRGRGIIQLTGRYNYTEFTKDTGIDIVSNPDFILESTENLILPALWFWKQKNLNALCDLNDVKKVTKRINGGYHHLTERRKLYEQSMSLWDK